MYSRSSLSGVLLCAFNVLLMVSGIWGNADPLLYRKPWPTYSLQNMPQTRFTCHDKILGGYYADAETQCQMFHVCVKVAGVGVQDFRFLCPNGTAFDQEAQICADWGDVDCEQSVLYYGSDNFDLYRLGSGFESKRAPLAEEEEATFHLQRAESGDIRRSKETRVDQKSRPEQPPNYTKHYEAATARNSFHNYAPNTQHQQQHHHQNRIVQKPSPPSQFADEVAKRPIVNYYTPTTTTPTTTSTTSTTTTTERYNDESKQDFDEIFKGSHSSHFFSNRNGGREDDFGHHEAKSKPNDFNDYSRKSVAEQTTSSKGRSQPTRAKRIKPATTTTTTTTRVTTTPPRVTKKQPAYSTDFYDHRATSTTQRPTTTLHHQTSPVHRFSFAAHDYPTQEKIQPTTYNPGNSFYHLKVTTPRYSELTRSTAGEGRPAKTTKAPKSDPRNSTFVNTNEFGEFFKLAKPQRGQTYQQQQQPQPFQPSPVFRAPLKTPEHDIAAVSPQQRGHPGRVSPAEPAPFRQRSSAARDGRVAAPSPPPTTKPELKPRGFASRGSINYKATTASEAAVSSGYGESSTQGAKKFSTLVPKDQFTPTTFKPTTYKKPYDNGYNFQGQQTSRTSAPKSVTRAGTFSTTESTTAKPFYNIDEDDGQYHPELWDVDYSTHKTNSHRASTSAAGTATVRTTPIPTQRSFQHSFNARTHQQQAEAEPVDLSDEEELFKTAHSLNFGAASINKLRADIFKAEKNSQQYNSQYSPNGVTTSLGTTTPTTTHRPPTTHGRSTVGTYYTTPITTTTTTTKRPTTSVAVSTTTQRTTYPTYEVKSSKPKSTKSSSKSGKGKKSSKKASSKRPPHADEDTSYDYAYYDTDSLSESPQDYHEYEIAEFSKTRKN